MPKRRNLLSFVREKQAFGDQLKVMRMTISIMSDEDKLTEIGFLCSASAVPNAVIDDETQEIVYRDYCDVSFAAATPKGLVVPVLRNAEAMSFKDVETNISLLAEKAKNNQLAMEDMVGGTFTISNGGVFGSLYGTPIINMPQSAILGMHATKVSDYC